MLDDNQDILNEYVIESREGLAEVETELLRMETSGTKSDTEAINKMFRAVHSIKGAAGFMGLAVIGELSHGLENVFNRLRNHELEPSPGRVSVLLEATDTLKALIEDIQHSDSVDIAVSMEHLDAVARGDEIAAPVKAVEPIVANVVSTECTVISSENTAGGPPVCSVTDLPEELTKTATMQALEAGRNVYVLEFDLLADREPSMNLTDLAQRLSDVGEILAATIDRAVLPGIHEDTPKSMPCLVVLASVISPATFARFWKLPEQGLHQLKLDAVPGAFSRRAPVPKISAETTQPLAPAREVGSEMMVPVVSVEPPQSRAVPAMMPQPTTDVTPALPAMNRSVPAAPVSVAPKIEITSHNVRVHNLSAAPEKSDVPTVVPTTTAAPKAVAATPAPAASNAPAPVIEAPKIESNIRVSVAVLDRLMNLAGELVLSRNQLLQTVGAADLRLLESFSARINQVTSELQETIMQTRMQQIGTVFNKFTRIVRDLSGTLGKQCQLLIEGQEVELDKTIIEAIGDPLTHLIRNSVDHGVELPDVRESRGKSPRGTIHLRAAHEDGKVKISISDDGAGIDHQRLRKKAVEKHLLTQEQADVLNESDALKLIFLPGFSTAEQITAVSGRGVGMDVVKTNIEKLGGSIDIDTQIGRGTTMTIRLPLTLAIIPSLIVHVGGQRFAVPQVNISELVRIRQGDDSKRIERVRNAEVLRLRGSLLPLIRLSSVLADAPPSGDAASEFERALSSVGEASAMSAEGSSQRFRIDSQVAGSETEGTGHATNILVVECRGAEYGLIVDGLHDSEEIVVKPLGAHFARVPFLAGATVLGDGQIALILDINGLANHCDIRFDTSNAQTSNDGESSTRAETFSTLLFTNHPGEQFAIPMSSVARIERIRADQIDTVAGHEVLQYGGGTLSLLSLENIIAARPREVLDRLFVIVFRAGDREVGLIAPAVSDIRELSTELDQRTFAEVGVMGSLVVDGKTTRVLDTYDLTQRCHPEWFSHFKPNRAAQQFPDALDREIVAATTGTSGVAPMPHHSQSVSGFGQRPKLLLAEDSTFFRGKIKAFIEQIGADVITAEDGQQAWDILCRNEHQFAGVVTDIEMPNMNGFELCARIRDDAQWHHVPVIALTSLASDEHVDRGRRVGINEYLIKLDRDKLVLAITSLLAGAQAAQGAALCAR